MSTSMGNGCMRSSTLNLSLWPLLRVGRAGEGGAEAAAEVARHQVGRERAVHRLEGVVGSLANANGEVQRVET